MNITLAQVGAGPRSRDPFDGAVRDYLKRSIGIARCGAESFQTEAAFFDWLGRQKGRTDPALLMLDARGRQISSEALAEWFAACRAGGTQLVVFAVGPPDGWSEEARSDAKRRGALLSLGPMTLAHQLARLVMAEQIYRACTILTGHPYHKGH